MEFPEGLENTPFKKHGSEKKSDTICIKSPVKRAHRILGR